jgi:polyisoprenoid-binding protein YceI
MRLLIATVAALGLTASQIRAQDPAAATRLVEQKWEVDPQHSSVVFIARILRVVKVVGRFPVYSATIIYNPQHPDQSSVTAIILTKSINTDMAFRDTHLKSPDFLDAERYPFMVFQSDSVRPSSAGLAIAGRLTLHGITRQVVLPATVVLPPTVNNPASGIATVAFEATLKLSRADFAIAGTNKFNPDFDPATNLVADSVDVTLEMAAQRQGYHDRKFETGPPPSVGDTLLRTIEARGIDAALRLYTALRSSSPRAYNFGAGQLDLLGHLLVDRGHPLDAVKIFQQNAAAYPANAGVLDALGEADCLVGDRAGAQIAFARAAQLDSTDTTPIEMLRRLRTVK